MTKKIWSHEREALVEKLYPTNVSTAEIVKIINKLPGPPVRSTHILISHVCKHMNVSRPALFVWTPERETLLRELYQTNTKRADILKRINELPGDPVQSVQSMSNHAVNKLGVFRPTHFLWTEERDAVLRRFYPGGMSRTKLLMRINALPGTPITSAEAVVDHAQAILGLKRARATIWTEERDGLLAALYKNDIHLDDIFSRLNALPGEPIPTKSAVTSRANQVLLVKRSASERNKYMRTPTQQRHIPRVFVNQEPVVATLQEIRTWAKTYGVRFRDWEDMRIVNSAREDRFLPVFKREFGRRVA